MTLISDETLQRLRERAERSRSGESPACPAEPPIIYLPRGRTYARFYRDSEGQYIRWFYVHKCGQDWIRCVGPLECKICRQIRAHCGYSSPTRGYRSRLICLCYAWLDHRGGKSKAEFGQHVLLWGPERFGDKLASVVRELESDEKRHSFFDPAANQGFVEIYHGSRPTQINVTVSMKIESPVLPLPREFPPLSRRLVIENEEPDRAQLEKLLLKVEAACKKRL